MSSQSSRICTGTECTELALMSTSALKATAFSYAKSDVPLVFKYKTEGLTCDCSIDYLSVYPGEAEHLYPPLRHVHNYIFSTEYREPSEIAIS